MDDFAEKAIELTKLLNISVDLLGVESNRALFFALGQILHDKVNESKLSEIEKGEVISAVIRALVEENEEYLAHYNNFMRTYNDGKCSTLH